MAGRKSDFTLPTNTLDELFSTQEERDDAKLSKIRDIPLELIDDFPDHPFKVRDDEDMFEFLGTPRYAQWNIKVHFSAYTGEWNIEGKSYDRSNVKAYSTYGTGRINAYKIIEETLNLKDVRIFDYVEDADGKKKAILNKKETAIAQAKQELIKQGFQDWVWSDPERRERLCRLYNDKFNSLRPREYDGSHIVFSGMNPEIELREHQRNAVAHMPIGMLVVLDSILNRITQNRAKGKNTFIFIDEIYLLFQHEYSANFLFTLWKRVRKYGAYATGITQNVDDLLQSHTARTMLANSEFIVMLNQASTDRLELAKLLNISDTQLSYITNVDAGHGLIKVGSNLVPFANKFPKNTKLYKLMTTKTGEGA